MGHGARVLIDRLRGRQKSDKDLGQHFLHDESVLDSIMKLAQLSEHDSVIEIGPGPGTLTERLLDSGVELCCIELDSGACLNLLEVFPTLNLIEGDALEVEWPAANKVVANIPYQISSPLIDIITKKKEIDYVVILVQEEFAERLVIANIVDRGSLGMCIAMDWECKMERKVPSHCFVPAPQVTSRLVTMKRKNAPNESRLAKLLIRQAFEHRRKKLRNTLSKVPKRLSRIKGWHASLYRDALQSIDSALLEKRPEELSFEEWVALAQNFAEYKSSEG